MPYYKHMKAFETPSRQVDLEHEIQDQAAQLRGLIAKIEDGGDPNRTAVRESLARSATSLMIDAAALGRYPASEPDNAIHPS